MAQSTDFKDVLIFQHYHLLLPSKKAVEKDFVFIWMEIIHKTKNKIFTFSKYVFGLNISWCAFSFFTTNNFGFI